MAQEESHESSSDAAVKKGTEHTRVCLKNIPPSMTEALLTKHLTRASSSSISKRMIVTDCKLLKTKEGKSRKLAFVGFKDADMAAYCVSHFHKTYAGTSRLVVELAFAKTRELDATTVQHRHRPWSKHSEGSSKHDAAHQKQKAGPTPGKESNTAQRSSSHKKKTVDAKKEEFLAAMGAGHKRGQFWSNDDGIPAPPQQQQDIIVDQSRQEIIADKSKSDTLGPATTTIIRSNTTTDNDECKSPLMESAVSDTVVMDSDMDFLRSKVTRRENILSDQEESESESENSGDDSSSVPSSGSSEDESEEEEEEPRVGKQGKDTVWTATATTTTRVTTTQMMGAEDDYSPTRLFVRNLPFQTTEAELQAHFGTYGTVVECHIPIDDTKKRKGYAFVRFAARDVATAAKEALDRTDFQGRLIHVLAAKKAPHEMEREALLQDDRLSSLQNKNKPNKLLFKQQQEKERQRNAPSTTTGWNASILRTDAVVDNLVSRLEIQKSDILTDHTTSSTSAAVRLALGETHILQENREYFATHGIDMEGLLNGVDNGSSSGGGSGEKHTRSLTQILVKNLPYNSNQEELLHKLFADHHVQTPLRLLLPPSKTVALLEYEHPTEARTVFRKLAYKRYQHVPLYMEWALLNASLPTIAATTTGTTRKTETERTDGGVEAVDSTKKSSREREEEEEDLDTGLDDDTTHHSIFVKNLNFSTTEKDLLRHFTKEGGIVVRAAKIPMKVTPSSQRLSMGYGFVECASSQDARLVLKKLNTTLLQGHALQLSMSSKRVVVVTQEAASEGKKRQHGGTKKKKLPTILAVKNVPFQASKAELTSLFGTYGKLKSLRLPKKFGSAQHRGFGFVEFVTGEEARTASEQLSRTHLYGRKLVLEWADDDAAEVGGGGVDNDKEGRRATAPSTMMDTMPKAKKIRFTD